MDPKQHAEKIDQVMQDIQDGVFDNLKALENRLAEIVSTSGGSRCRLCSIITRRNGCY